MKKVIKWTLYFLALAATVLCFVFPVQAKEVSDNIMSVLNTPIAIAGISITIGGLLTFVITKYIMNNTKYGRKELDGIKGNVESAKNEMGKYKEKVDAKVADIENKYGKLADDCESKVTVMLDQFEDLQNNTLNALETIPNKKVQGIVAEYKAKYQEKKAEIINKTINTNEYIDMKIAEMKAQFNDFMEKIKNEEAKDNKATEE